METTIEQQTRELNGKYFLTEVEIIPTNEITEEGYRKAKIIIDGKESYIDSFTTEGLVSFDFEVKGGGGFKIWNFAKRQLEVVFNDSLNVSIKAL